MTSIERLIFHYVKRATNKTVMLLRFLHRLLKRVTFAPNTLYNRL